MRLRLVTYALQVIKRMELRAQSSVYAQELFVHNSSKGKRTEGVHTGLIDSLRVLMLAFELEGEVIRQMATFMVTAEQPESVGIPNLQ